MKVSIKLLLFLLALTLSALSSGAMQNTRLFNDRNLVSSNYSSFCLDSDSTLWIGTEYGLIRFDGANFEKYLHSENDSTSLSDNRIIKIMRDRQDRIWVATCEGLNLYDPASDSFKLISLPNISFNGYISDICQLANNDIIFIVAGVGLYIIDFSSGEPCAVRFMPMEVKLVEANTICGTKSGKLLLGNHSGEVTKVEANGRLKSVKLADTYIQFLLSDNDGTVYVGTTEQLWRWNPEKDLFEEIMIPSTVNPPLHNATFTHNGDLIVGTMRSGLFILKNGSDQLVPCREYNNAIINLDKARISTVYEDPLKNLWLGCSHQGIVMAPEAGIPFNFINLNTILDDYEDGYTNIVVLPDDNRIWMGLDDNRLISIDKSGNVLSSTHLGGVIRSMATSRTGKLYLGVDDNGLYELDPDTGKLRQLYSLAGRYMARGITEDHDGNIYFGIHGRGVAKIDPKTLSHEFLSNNKGNPIAQWPSSLFCDSRGRIWIGMFSGMMTYDPATGETDSISDRYPLLVKGVHNEFAEDKDGNIWDAASNGLFVINPDTDYFRHLTPNEGLPDIYIATIIFDRDGNAWIGTHDHICRIDKSFNVMPLYNNNPMSDMDYYSSTASNDGRYLLFSGSKGVTSFEPALISNPKVDRMINVSAIYLNGKKVNRNTLTSAGDRTVITDGDTDFSHINLSYNDNSLTLLLTTRDFGATDNLIYQWRIPGVIDQWMSATPGTAVISLPHLQHGNHKIELRATENGILSPTKTVNVSVSAPWYLSLPVKIFFAALVVALIVMLVILIRKKSSERINEEKIKFFINVSHEIRSPLTLIISPLEKLLRKQLDPDTAKNLNTIHRNANRILALINQLLDLRKIDKGKMEIKCTDTELISFTRDLVEIFQPQAEEKHQKLEFATSDPQLSRLDVCIDRNNFDKILVNLITNALKYTPGDGEICVSVGRGFDPDMGDYAEITVSDTGIGLDEKNIDKLFDRFYQGNFNKGAVPLGFGIGLDLCRQLVELHRGTISASNRTDCKGSRFIVRIPLKLDLGDTSNTSVTSAPDHTAPESGRNLIINFDTLVPSTDSPAPRNRKNPSLKILLVDDDAEIRSYLGDALSTIGKVYEAVNGEDAMRSVMKNRPDLIVSDVVMPQMDGLQLLKTIKTNVTTNHIPVILLSSKNDVADRMAGWDKGADGYIGKPFNINELLALIDNLIDNRLRLKGKFSGLQEQDDKIETPALKGNDTSLIDKIVREINDHLDDPNLNVEKLCQEVGLSRAHLNRRMKELFGLTPSEFIRNMRMRKACDLLKQGDIDISQIAYSIGFTSQPHFSTVFKRFTGYSPSEYRSMNS